MLNPALLVSGGHLREDKKKKKANAALSPVDSTVWEVLLLPLATHKTFAGFFHLQSLCACLSTPSSFPSTQQLGVSGSQPVTLWRARQIQAQHGKHITSVSAWEHLALPGCEGPSVCLSDSEPTHTLLVYTGVVMAPQFLLLHRYWFIIQTINNLYNTKANRLNVIIKHRTILWILN